jgi:hypothetical protein
MFNSLNLITMQIEEEVEHSDSTIACYIKRLCPILSLSILGLLYYIYTNYNNPLYTVVAK